MSLSYTFKSAIKNILYDKWINILCVITIATGLLFTTITWVFVYNIDASLKKLPERFSVMLFLKDFVTQSEIDKIIKIAKNNTAVDKVIYVPKDEALKQLKKTLKNTEYVLEGLDVNPLPDSIEIRFKDDALSPENVKKLTSTLNSLNGISEIEYGEEFLSSLYSLKKGLKIAGIVFIIILAITILFVSYSTVKILFYRRKEEIETYKLLGAKKWFIRAPFIIEGSFLGFSAGLLSYFGVVAIYYLFFVRLSLTFPIFKAMIFPLNYFILLPFLGTFLGICGSVIAIGRIRY
jgi:cell division transport system permease protein